MILTPLPAGVLSMLRPQEKPADLVEVPAEKYRESWLLIRIRVGAAGAGAHHQSGNPDNRYRRPAAV